MPTQSFPLYAILKKNQVVFTAETAGEILAFLDSSGSPPGSPVATLCRAEDFRALHVSPQESTQERGISAPTERQ